MINIKPVVHDVNTVNRISQTGRQLGSQPTNQTDRSETLRQSDRNTDTDRVTRQTDSQRDRVSPLLFTDGFSQNYDTVPGKLGLDRLEGLRQVRP